MNVDEIAKIVGLQHPIDEYMERARNEAARSLPLFRHRSKREVEALKYRNTGRTTAVILSALEAFSHGKDIVFIAATYAIAEQMMVQAKRWAVRLGFTNFPRTAITCCPAGHELRIRGSNAFVYYDHTYYELSRRAA